MELPLPLFSLYKFPINRMNEMHRHFSVVLNSIITVKTVVGTSFNTVIRIIVCFFHTVNEDTSIIFRNICKNVNFYASISLETVHKSDSYSS